MSNKKELDAGEAAFVQAAIRRQVWRLPFVSGTSAGSEMDRMIDRLFSEDKIDEGEAKAAHSGVEYRRRWTRRMSWVLLMAAAMVILVLACRQWVGSG
jgi:type VI protein secretion system component VasK